MDILKLDLEEVRGVAVDAPEHLSAEAQALWAEYVQCFAFADPHVRTVLTTAMEAYDRMRQAQEILREESPITHDSKGKPLVHPAVRMEDQARTAMLAALKQLKIDVLPPRAGAGRPPKTEQYLDGFS